MLITFKSPANHDVVMFEKNALELLTILGKDANASIGVVTIEQLPEAIARLKAALASEPENHANVVLEDDAEADSDEVVSIGQRALPLMELLEFSLEEKVPVTWGV